MHFAVTILGNNSAIPAHGRHPSAQLVTLKDQLFLVDCGEGTQMQLAQYRIRVSRIRHILISHLHGDHYFGLIGLLNSFGLHNRTLPLHVYGPPALENILQLQLNSAHTQLPYPLLFHPLKSGQNGILIQEKQAEVRLFPTRHRIDCFGFLFSERHAPRKILPEKAAQWHIPFSFYPALQQGADYQTTDGLQIANADLTTAGPANRRYAYCADTLYDEGLLPYISGCDLLYHEATYLHEAQQRAASRFHSTALQAGTLARKAKAGRLLIGHYSSIYPDPAPLAAEAREAFSNTDASREGTTYLV